MGIRGSAYHPQPGALLPLCPARTGGLICSQDALARSHNPVSNVRELLLLLRGQCWVLVGHGACRFLGRRQTREGLVSRVFPWSPNKQGPLPGGQGKGSLPPLPHNWQDLGHLLSPALPYT